MISPKACEKFLKVLEIVIGAFHKRPVINRKHLAGRPN